MFRHLAGAAVAAISLLAAPAFADDWQAVKLRGIVLQLVDSQWQPLQRGDIVPDTRVIRTTVSGHAEFTRGGETIDLEPNTQIQIFDKAHHEKPYTTIVQQFGTVSVEAQVQNVQHFAVDTPFLAAVVKGTRFVVTSGKTGGSVQVNRGHVQVTDKINKTHVLLSVGQSAVIDKVKTGGGLLVQGAGALPPVLDSRGRLVSDTGLDLGIAGNLARLQVGGNSGLVNVSVGGSLANVAVGGSNGLANVNVGNGLAGVQVGGSNGVANVNVGGNSGISANVGGGGSVASANVGGSNGVSANVGGSGGAASVNVGGSGGVGVNVGGGGGLVNVHLGGLHLGL